MKKTYWLALWWWAARGFAHIWVIKYIEEQKIKIDEISWTSMGAIIASLYAIGKSSEEIRNIAKNINYLKLIDLDFKEWLLKWNKVLKYLETLFLDIKIEDLPISLKIVATNVENWNKKVFKKGKLVNAIRASISLPWVFKPHIIWKHSYMDWWIVNNLPIEVLDSKNVIAVSALKKVNKDLQRTKKFLWMNFNVWFINLNFQILQRSIILMMKQNEDRSIIDSKKNIILVEPDYGDLDFFHFKKIDDFIKVWYKKIKKCNS